MKKQGFTLIELLIVVAIIAILAAIAIPNFLQAQVRAKVSRAKADMRTIATGLETYYVDKNDYPGDYSEYLATSDSKYYYYYGRMFALTTPIAYMSSVPGDPFAQAIVPDPIETGFFSPYGSIEDSTKPAAVLSFDYACNDDGEQALFEALGDRIYKKEGLGARFMWALRSIGPDGISTPIGNDVYNENPEFPNEPYDPTNGTTSYGEIYRTNLGMDK